MKKTLLGIALVLCATVVHAEYLYWQVEEVTPGNQFMIDLTREHTFQVYATSDGGTTKNYLDSWQDRGTYVNLGQSVSSVAASEGLYANLSDFGTSDYTYYIEIVGYSTAGDAGWVNTSQSLAYTAASGNITTTLSSMATVPTAWTGGTFSAPEPTGAMLLLVGGALLALKRKRV